MKVFFIAGEASGDKHASLVAKELQVLDPTIQMQGWGGDAMQEQGVTVVKHYRELAFMGLVEVLKNLRTIKKNFARCKEDILAFQPDKVVFVDYPGFNLRMTKWVKEQGIETHHYISPTIWAWKENRVKTIKLYTDHMYCILPFEPEVYAKHGYHAPFVGHPLLDALGDPVPIPRSKTILLAPGSRRQELHKILPVFLKATQEFPEYDVVVAGAPGLTEEDYRPYIMSYSNVKLVFGETQHWMQHARVGAIASGTATLEATLRGLPMVVGYAANPISIWLVRRLVKIKYIALVNLILNREAVQELIQENLTPEKVSEAIKNLCTEQALAQAEKQNQETRQKLGGPGASKRVAQLILQT